MLPDSNHSDRLPLDMKKYFWDVSFEELTFEKYPRFISERLLNFGNLNDIKWLLTQTDPLFLQSLVETSRNLNDKTRNYWQMMLVYPDEI